MNPKGKVALITGGAHRVGKAITLMLAQAGADVVVNYNSSTDAANQTVAEAEAAGTKVGGINALALQCDVSDYASVVRMSDAISDRFGGVDMIINGASLFGRFAFPTQELKEIEAWRQITRTSIDGAFYICNSLVPSMIQRAKEAGEAGVIINIVDLSAQTPWPKFTAHAVGKAGLLALTRQLAVELAPAVRVNAIAPGDVLPPPKMSQTRIEERAQETLLQRWGRPDDVAKAVRYLIEADYVTGDLITVDGGKRWVR